MHQVTGQARLHGDLRGLEVADFADHHHVRVLAQDRAQPARERHLDARVDLRLADAVDVVLDRVLDRHDVARAVVDAIERGIERRRLAGAGRTGDEQDAVRLVDQLVDVPLRGRIHAQRVEVEPARLLVEQAQHDALAVPGRNGRHAHVDRATGDAERDAAVLRQALLGDVETRHDLDARDDQRRHRALGLQHLAQHAVDAEADHEPVLERLDVDVRAVFLDRLGQERVDQPDDRRLVLALEQVGNLRDVLREVREVGVFLEAAHRVHRGARARLVDLAQQRLELLRAGALDPQVAAQVTPHLGERERRGAVAEYDIGAVLGELAHQHAVALREREGQRPRRLGHAARGREDDLAGRGRVHGVGALRARLLFGGRRDGRRASPAGSRRRPVRGGVA